MFEGEDDFSLVYHPTTVVFLDDNFSFLKTLEKIFSKKMLCKFFLNIHEAFLFLEKDAEIRSTVRKTDDALIDNFPEKWIGKQFGDTFSLIYDINRFSSVSVAIIDFYMPEMNGVDFCKLIKDKQLMKIMLTGVADNSDAVSIFNQGLIDKFLLKTQDDLNSRLLNFIESLRKKFFQKKYRRLYDYLTDDVKKMIVSLEFKKIFNFIVKEKNAREWYLIDDSGSFLFLDYAGNPTLLTIKSEEEISKYIDIIENYGGEEVLLRNLKNRDHLLSFFTLNDMKKPISLWSDYLAPCRNFYFGYYYSIISKLKTDLIQLNKISSYQDYLML